LAGRQAIGGDTQSDIDKIRVVPGPARVTGPFLDVLALFYQAMLSGGDELHGWAIMKSTKRTGPTVYGVLDRLEDMGWIVGRWETEHPEPGKPRRRLYHLTPQGEFSGSELLRERRPDALRPASAQLLPGWKPIPRQAGAT
jgi:PadR family transcriptional regulator, regulatory protein PadR